MTRGLLLIMIILTSCRGTTLPTESLSIVDNELFCRGTKNMILYVKESQEIKSSFGNNLHNKGLIGLKIGDEVFKGLPFGSISDLNLEPTDTIAIKKLNYQCFNQSDHNPDFDLTLYFLPKKKVLVALVMIILEKPGYRNGYQFTTILDDNGQLGQMKVTTIQE